MSDREKNKLVSNGNTFGYGQAHTEWAKPPTEREIEKQHRASERSAFKRLTKQQKELLKNFVESLDEIQGKKGAQTVVVTKDPWWARSQDHGASIDQQWAKADINQLIENDPHRRGRASFKQNRPQNLSSRVKSSQNNKQTDKLPSKYPRALHMYRKLNLSFSMTQVCM